MMKLCCALGLYSGTGQMGQPQNGGFQQSLDSHAELKSWATLNLKSLGEETLKYHPVSAQTSEDLETHQGLVGQGYVVCQNPLQQKAIWITHTEDALRAQIAASTFVNKRKESLITRKN